MKSRKLAYALAISVISLLTGCGSSGSNGGTAGLPTCQYAGQPGCVAPNYGNGGSTSPAGCLNLSSPIYFTGSGQFIGNVLATGNIPNYGTYGGLAIYPTQVSAVGGSTWTSPSGLQINIANSYAGSQTTLSGVLQLSQAAQYNIMMTTQGNYSYSGSYYQGSWGSPSSFYGYGSGYGSSPYGTTSSACVSGLALQLAPYTSVNGVYGYAYIYLNNTQHGYILQLY